MTKLSEIWIDYIDEILQGSYAEVLKKYGDSSNQAKILEDNVAEAQLSADKAEIYFSKLPIEIQEILNKHKKIVESKLGIKIEWD